MVVGDEVIARVSVDDIPAGTFGIVQAIYEEGILVDVYVPADVPEDPVCFSEGELILQ